MSTKNGVGLGVCVRVTPRVLAPKKHCCNLTRDQRRYQTCVHEAGHTVLAYCYGMHLDQRGCYLTSDDEGFSGRRVLLYDWDADAEGVIVQAGTIAEWRWRGKSTRMTGMEWAYFYMRHRKYKPQPGEPETDPTTLLRIAEQVCPRDPYAPMGRWNWRLLCYLREEVVWDLIIRTANELFVKTHLSARSMKRLIREVVGAVKAKGQHVPNEFTQALFGL